jgi:formylglycine-generating enzyme required for sulfatase activity
MKTLRFSGLLAVTLTICLSTQGRAQLGSVSIQTQNPAVVSLGWGTTSGKQYEVWAAPSLPPAWVRVTNGLAGTGNPLTLDLSIGSAAAFYRVAETGPSGGPDPARFALISPGTFTMGSPATEPDRGLNEEPQTIVTLTRSFWMGRFEVTQAEYLPVVGSNPSRWTNTVDEPVENVSWRNATNYCFLLTESERAAGRLPDGHVYRLPTEAEWEYTCRAGTTTRFSYGDDLGYSDIGLYAWYETNASYRHHPVGTKQPNPWGFYDMPGNVGEWCWDNYFGLLPGGSVTDPSGPAPNTANTHVTRGGSCYSWGDALRSAYRGFVHQNYTDSTLGFRVVLAAPL